jgi:hypothetical protein
MTDTTQPEALRLADELAHGYPLALDAMSAAAELRRLHARVTELEAQAPAVPAVPHGWKLVPVEPTEAMFTRFSQQIETGVVYVGGFLQAYRCMLEAAPQPEAQAQAAPRVCRRCNGTGKVKLHNWGTGGDRWQDCWDCAKGFPPRLEAPAVPGEIDLIEKAAKRVGITSLLNHGAASCVYSEGCAGVSQEHLLAYTREIALHCAVSLAAQGGV